MRANHSKIAVGLSLLGGACALHAAACSSSSSATTPLPTPGDASYSLPPAGDDMFADGDTPVLTNVRIAHASPDAPALDVCVAPHGTAQFQGPLLAHLAASLAAASGTDAETSAGGVSFAQVSAYLPIAPGQYDVRLVAAGASSCDPPAGLDGQNENVDDSGGDLDADGVADGGAAGPEAGAVSDGGVSSVALPDWTNLPALQASAFATLLIAGDLTPAGGDAPIGVTVLPDDAVLAGGIASLRAINAVPSAPVLDLGLGSGAEWMPMLTGVAFGKASSMTGPGQGATDANGYVPIPTFSGQAMSACAASSDAGSDVATASAIDVDVGAIATVMAVGGKTGDAAHPPALLFCNDNEPAGGLLADCSVAQ